MLSGNLGNFRYIVRFPQTRSIYRYGGSGSNRDALVDGVLM